MEFRSSNIIVGQEGITISFQQSNQINKKSIDIQRNPTYRDEINKKFDNGFSHFYSSDVRSSKFLH